MLKVFGRNGAIFRNVKEHIISANDVTLASTGGTNVNLYFIQLPSDVITLLMNVVDGYTLLSNGSTEVIFDDYDDVSQVGNYYGGDNRIRYIASKTDTLQDVQNALSGVLVNYKLETPYIEKLDGTNILLGYEDFTQVSVESEGLLPITDLTYHNNLIDSTSQISDALEEVKHLANKNADNKELNVTLLNVEKSAVNLEGWVDDTANVDMPFWYYQIDMNITSEDIPSFGVDAKQKYDGKADKLTGDIYSFDGYIRIYALAKPDNDLDVDIGVIK